MKISIITPWHNNSRLIEEYERSVREADEVIVIDNASDYAHAPAIARMVARLNGILIANPVNKMFSAANNQGLEVATGDIVLFLNNDIAAQAGWINTIRGNIDNESLFGAVKLAKPVGNYCVEYLEGWCLWGKREIFKKLGGWDDVFYTGLYWEDNDLCFRAIQAGYKLKEIAVPIVHFANATTGITPGAFDHVYENMDKFTERVNRALSGV